MDLQAKRDKTQKGIDEQLKKTVENKGHAKRTQMHWCCWIATRIPHHYRRFSTMSKTCCYISFFDCWNPSSIVHNNFLFKVKSKMKFGKSGEISKWLKEADRRYMKDIFLVFKRELCWLSLKATNGYRSTTFTRRHICLLCIFLKCNTVKFFLPILNE